MSSRHGTRRRRSPESPRQPHTPPSEVEGTTNITRDPTTARVIKKGKAETLSKDSPEPEPESTKPRFPNPQFQDPIKEHHYNTACDLQRKLKGCLKEALYLAQNFVTQLADSMSDGESFEFDYDSIIDEYKPLEQWFSKFKATVQPDLNDETQPENEKLPPNQPPSAIIPDAPTYSSKVLETPPTQVIKPSTTKPLSHTNPTTAKQGQDKTPLNRTGNIAKSSQHSSQRLIMQFQRPLTALPQPHLLRDNLNARLGKGTPRLQGLNLSKAGHLILHIASPFTAAQMIENQSVLWEVVREYFKLPENPTPRLLLDRPWHRLVIHRIPIVSPNQRALVLDELTQWNSAIKATDVMGMRELCSLAGLEKRRACLDAGIPQFTSMLVMFADASAARRCLRDGVFLFGSHCRVSAYDPNRHSKS